MEILREIPTYGRADTKVTMKDQDDTFKDLVILS